MPSPKHLHCDLLVDGRSVHSSYSACLLKLTTGWTFSKTERSEFYTECEVPEKLLPQAKGKEIFSEEQPYVSHSGTTKYRTWNAGSKTKWLHVVLQQTRLCHQLLSWEKWFPTFPFKCCLWFMRGFCLPLLTNEWSYGEPRTYDHVTKQ